MEIGNTYVNFALTGENFDPKIVTDIIGIYPTETWNKGDKGEYKSILDYTCWKLSLIREKNI